MIGFQPESKVQGRRGACEGPHGGPAGFDE